jgi:hypothetical protein
MKPIVVARSIRAVEMRGRVGFPLPPADAGFPDDADGEAGGVEVGAG